MFGLLWTFWVSVCYHTQILQLGKVLLPSPVLLCSLVWVIGEKWLDQDLFSAVLPRREGLGLLKSTMRISYSYVLKTVHWELVLRWWIKTSVEVCIRTGNHWTINILLGTQPSHHSRFRACSLEPRNLKKQYCEQSQDSAFGSQAINIPGKG